MNNKELNKLSIMFERTYKLYANKRYANKRFKHMGYRIECLLKSYIMDYHRVIFSK